MSLAAQRLLALLVVFAIPLGSAGLVYAGGFGPAQGAGGGGSSLSGLGSTDNAVVRTDGTSGDRVQGSLVTISDTGDVVLPPSAAVLGQRFGLTTTPTTIRSGGGNPVQMDVNNQVRASFGPGALNLTGSYPLVWFPGAITGSPDTGLKRSSAGVVQVTDGSTGNGILMAGVCLGRLKAADFNVTTDQAITIRASRYVVRRIVVANASVSLDTAAGGIYTAANKGGVDLVAATQVYSALTASTKFLDLTLEAEAGTDVLTDTTLYLSLTTPQGVAATADVYVYGDALP